MTPLLYMKHKKNLSAISVVLNKSNLCNLFAPAWRVEKLMKAGDSFGIFDKEENIFCFISRGLFVIVLLVIEICSICI